MCLGVPGQVASLHEIHGTPMGEVSFGSVSKEACMALVPDIEVGDWVMVHAGVAIAQLDEAAAAESIRLMSEMLAAER